MTAVTLLAALARNGVIGDRGTIPWRLPGELAHFKAITMGHALIMGRATFDSIGRALPGRHTIVVTRDPQWQHPGVESAHSFEDALGLAGPAGEVFVAGGAQIYALALPFAQRMILTHVPLEPPGDTYFPPVDLTHWSVTERREHPAYAIVTYERL